MFRVRNCLPGTLALDLETGAIHLMSGKSFDLEEVCSREWIDNDPTLRHFIDIKALEIAFDSNVKVSKDPVKKAVIEKPVSGLPTRRTVPRANIVNIPEIVVPKITKTVVEVLTPEPDPVEAAVQEEEKQDRLITFEDTLTEEEIKETKKSKGRRGRKHSKDSDSDET